MLDHIGLRVADVAAAQAFYDAALAPLGIAVIVTVSAEQTGSQAYLGYGSDGRPYFWIGAGQTSTRGLHVAFTADSRAKVDAFYAAAMAAGGKDNGGPGVRPYYHPNYYGAFVLDADGHNVEAVCRQPA
jgi:catechol 2,3-dioxygenase-like lactoylglutathione lyase family enzyme